MESLNDLIFLALTMLDSGFDFQPFLGWKEMCILILMVGRYHYYDLALSSITEPNLGALSTGRRIPAAQELLSSGAIALRANRILTGIELGSLLPRDLSTHRNL